MCSSPERKGSRTSRTCNTGQIPKSLIGDDIPFVEVEGTPGTCSLDGIEVSLDVGTGYAHACSEFPPLDGSFGGQRHPRDLLASSLVQTRYFGFFSVGHFIFIFGGGSVAEFHASSPF